MTHFESDVPQHVQDLLDDLLEVGILGCGPRRRIVEEHDINVGIRTEFAAPVAANGDEGDGNVRGIGVGMMIVVVRGLKHVAEHHIQHLGSTLGNFAAPSPRAMQHPQAVFFDLQELLVEAEYLRRACAGLQNEPFFGMPKHFIEVAQFAHEATIGDNPYAGKLKHLRCKCFDIKPLYCCQFVTVGQLTNHGLGLL